MTIFSSAGIISGFSTRRKAIPVLSIPYIHGYAAKAQFPRKIDDKKVSFFIEKSPISFIKIGLFSQLNLIIWS